MLLHPRSLEFVLHSLR
jgi:hypothetical protein